MANLKIFTENIDPLAVNQIYEMLAQSTFKDQQVRIMPDAHAGSNCVVGFTSTLGDKIIPNVIGVDIGCGMRTVMLGKIDVDLPALDNFIKTNIPAGSNYAKEENGRDLIESLHVAKQLRDYPRLFGSIGSLGGGNHFIEIDEDFDGNKYLVIHSGSRNLGMQVASIYQKLAVRDCKGVAEEERNEVIQKLKAQGRISEIPDAIKEVNAKFAYRSKIPNDYCYLDGIHAEKYLHDMRICQVFAERNRAKMAEKILKFLGVRGAEYFETVHNYIDENNVVRKGAISAKKGEKVIIPMNMRDGCFIAIGKGNPDWNFSAPHGAGRLVSRSDAKKLFTEEEFKQEMKGIYTTTADKSTIDESPMAYKPSSEIEALISPTVEVIAKIFPIYNFKAGD